MDYDADSDSMDEFPAEDFEDGGEVLSEDFLGEEDPEAEEEDEGDASVASTSGDGPIVQFAGLPDWCVTPQQAG